MAMTASAQAHAEGRAILACGVRDVLSLSASDMAPLADPRHRMAELGNAFCPASVGVLGTDESQVGDRPVRDSLVLRVD